MSASMTSYAIVTGASQGIGQACALALLQQGWHVALVGRHAETLNAVAKMTSEPERAFVCPTDISNPNAVAVLYQRLRHQWPRLDLLFNNAGLFTPAATPDETSLDHWHASVNTNLNGAFYMLQQAFAWMRQQSPQGGRIINNGSIAAQVPRPRSVSYAATKSAMTGLTRSAALDGRNFNIAVGQIDIGNVASEMTAAMAKGALQADGSVKSEARMDMSAVVDTFMAMVKLPLSANVLNTTVYATGMPFVGRG